MARYADDVAKAFVEGRAKKSPLSVIGMSIFDTEKGRRLTTDGNVLLSYDWWTVADRTENGLVRVTRERYQTGEWKSGKPKYSPTTDSHIKAVVNELGYAGYHYDCSDERWDYYAR
jgi:hypothetical protein